ncbi:Hexokinase [Spraguea lophii 42_110]|uniref:Phosphotransferase n=1 Tax=Spraguea lophii (strain 42_110) TaxID=1358809 RepID=S7W5Q4_SPRLO|nr:Hexokinase [Spraguea lophii 42_110]
MVKEFKFSSEDKLNLANAFKKIVDKKTDNMFLDTCVTIKENKINKEFKALAIDVGGTYLKLGLFEIKNNNEIKALAQAERFKILKDGSLKDVDLFEWICEKTKKYLEDNNVSGCLKAAMCFSYPLLHKSLKDGIIMTLGKNFPFKSLKSECNVSLELNKVFEKNNINVNVEAVINDVTATVTSSYRPGFDLYVGIVLGTGTNAGYIKKEGDEHVVINCEWAVFDHPTLKKTTFDKKIEKLLKDKNNVHYNPLDVLIGGYKFVEIINLIMKEKNLKELNLNEILEIQNSEDKKYDETKKIIYTVKKRNSVVIASLIFGIIEHFCPTGKILITLNGSVFEYEFDMNLLEAECDKLKEILEKHHYEIEYDVQKNASLIGAMKVLNNCV